MPNRVRFGAFEFELRAGELSRGMRRILLQEQPFQILLMLVQGGGDVVTLDEIRKRLWPNDTVVEFDHSIHTAIKKLRRALGDSADSPKYVETVARRGYRLLMPVEPCDELPRDQAPAAVEANRDSDESDNDETTAGAGLIGKKVSHYRVLEILGGGGMGVLYKAEDLRLGRRVALKFLPEELASDADALHRFEREARAASALNHHNICTIYQIEEHEGQPFIVMELLEGETLRELISARAAGASPLPVETLLDLAAQVTEGLGAAHQKGIIHRDIKPANIFTTMHGQVKILDFGLAKQEPESLEPPPLEQHLPRPEADPHVTLTRTGITVGTAGYMSPEQVRGEKVDARTDLFSFGLVLYELATGQRAFPGETAPTVHAATLNSVPKPVRELNPNLPPALEEIIRRAIEKDRELRYQSAAALLSDLKRLSGNRSGQPSIFTPTRPVARDAAVRNLWPRWVLGGALVLLAAVSVAAYFSFRPRAASHLTEQDTVVLADFANSTGDEIFDDTLKSALRTALSESSFLNLLPENKVTATLGAMTRPTNTPLTPEVAREVCQRVGSKAYITGAIGTLGHEYVLELRAVNCQSGDTLAQQQITTPEKRKVLDSIGSAAAKLRGELGESLSKVTQIDVPLSEATTSSLDALKQYSLGARALAEKGHAAELPYNLRAIQLDPDFALAYLSAGRDYLNDSQSARAAEYISRAYQLRAHAGEREQQEIDSIYYLIVTGELDKAARAYEKTIQSYPRTASAYSGVSIVYAEQAHYEKAAEMQRQLTLLRPDVAMGYENLTLHLMSLQRLDEARQIAQAESARKLDTYGLHKGLYALAFLAGDARAMVEQLAWFAGNPVFVNLGLALQSDTEAYAGHLGKARELTRRVVDISLRDDDKEGAAKMWDNAALREAMFGNATQARQAAGQALMLAPASQRVEIEAALALAMIGDTKRAESLAQDLSKRFPLHTQLQSLWLPTINAQLAVARKKTDAAVDRLQAAAPVEQGYTPMHFNISCLYPMYVRGQAYLARGEGSAAAGEFQKIIDHNGIVWNCATGALAHLGLARANALEARTDSGVAADAARARAHAAYRDFLTLWKDADPRIPILKQAKVEYARFQ